MGKDIKTILIVCSGNSCRSIMAEAYLKKRLKEEGFTIDIKSAGTLGIDFMPPSKETIMVLREDGIDTEGYVSSGIQEDDIEWADLILVMEFSHKTRIINLVPGTEEKVFCLGGFNKEDAKLYIPDPIGRPLTFYKNTYEYIKNSIEDFLSWLKK